MVQDRAIHKPLLAWFDKNGRKDLPWQKPTTPYRVWISEIMLQQTQVATVIPYFERFMATFPDVTTLAQASLDDVLALWAGLGYYRRARFIHQAALAIVSDFGGMMPSSVDALTSLPGIGRSTAGAIVSLAFGKQAAILDGNVKRVFARYVGIYGDPSASKTQRELWQYAEEALPDARFGDYNQALMDLGALVCTRSAPACEACPLNKHCYALNNDATDELPEPKKRKTLPVRSKQFVLLRHNDALYLERRGPDGIWGGLWCTPIVDDLDDFITDLDVDTRVAQPMFRHTFSHFHLDIHPHEVALNTRPKLPGQWFSVDELNRIGYPKPIARLLAAQN